MSQHENLITIWLEHWGAWAFFAAYLVASYFAAILAQRLFKGVFSRLTARSATTLDDRLVQAAVGPVRFFVQTIGLRVSLEALSNRMPSFQPGATLGNEFGWLEKVAIALVVVAGAVLINAVLKAGLDWYLQELAAGNDANWEDQLLPILRRLLSLLVYFIAVSIILQNFGQDITALVTTAGVASLAVALAAQDTLSNMIGGFVILMDRPFKVGDVIELPEGKVGEVVEVGLRSTRIKQFDGNALVVPNKDMASIRIVNFALPTTQAAIRQTIGVDYGTDVERAKQVLLDTIRAHPEILKDPEPGVWFVKFSDSALDLFMACWVESYRERFRVTDELNVQILRAFRQAGINIPFPQRDLHLYIKEEGRQSLPAAGNRPSGGEG